MKPSQWRAQALRPANGLLYIIALVLGVLAGAGTASGYDRRSKITALDLVNVRDIGGHSMTVTNVFGALTVSPDERYVAFQLQTPNLDLGTYDLSWYVIEAKPNGKRWKVDDGGDVILNPGKSWFISGSRPPTEAQWSYNGNWIYYLKQLEGSIQLWRSKKDGSINMQLTHNPADILSFRISDDRKEVVFTTAIPPEALEKPLQEEGDRGFLYDERFHPHKASKPIARSCGVNGEGRALEVGIGRACSPPLWVYDIVSNTERRATAAEADAYDQQPADTSSLQLLNQKGGLGISRKDGGFIRLVNADPEQFTGYRPPLRLVATISDREFRCNAPECYGPVGVIENVWWGPARNEIIFQRADGSNGGMTGLYSWIPSEKEIRTILKTEDQLADCEVLHTRMICLREQWTHPRTIVSIALNTGDLQTIYDPNPEFDKFVFSEIETLEWDDEFGNPTHAHLVYPVDYDDDRRYPLVITTYSSRGFLRGAVGDEYPIHVLAASGFMVLSHDMPNPVERSASVSNSGQAQFEDNYERRSSLSAQEMIIDILDGRRLIDPERVAITGLSDGAAQVMYALVHSNSFAAAIASSASDYGSYYYSNNQRGRAFWRNVLGGTPYDDRTDIYKALSICLNVWQVDAPFLINVSDYELVNSIKSFACLQDAGKPVEMFVYPNEYHIKWQPQHRLAIYRRNLQWLTFWLMGKEGSDPVDPEQYKRWRELRRVQEDIN